jgi:hypothetical protein
MTGIEEAIQITGSAARLARRLIPPVTQQAVDGWKKQGWAPLGRAAQISALTGVDTTRLVKPSVMEAIGQ